MFSQDLFSQSLLKEKRTPVAKLGNTEEKKRLKEEIDDWKSLRAKIKKSLEYYKNIRPFPDKSCKDDEQIPDGNLQTLPNMGEIWKDELYRYSGMICTKYDLDGEYKFEFISSKRDSKKETYFVQILEVEEKGILGAWKMPMLLDANEILSKCPLNDIRKVKSFVILCKHYLDCQEYRRTQFEALKTYIGELYKCSVQANLEIYTCIQLQMFKLREVKTDKFYDIILYIIYELNESRPNKLIIDSLHEEPLSEDVLQKLRKFFKHFKLLELKTAFEKIIDEQNAEFFQWEKDLRDKDLIIENDEEENYCLSPEEANEPSETRSFSKGEENKESSQEDNENKSQRLKKSADKKKKTNRKLKTNNFQNEVTNPGLEEKSEKAEKKGKPNLRKRTNLKKTTITKHFQIEKSGINEKTETEGNLEKVGGTKKGERSKEVHKIRFEEEEKIEKEKSAKEDSKNKPIKKKFPVNKKSKVTKKPVKSGKQTKLDFSQKTNIEQAEDLNSQTKVLEEQGKNKETEIDPKSQKSRPKRKIEDKEKETENIEAITSKGPKIKETKGRGRPEEKITNIKKKDTITSPQGSEKTEIQKEKKIKSRIPKESIKKTFDLSNFILNRKTKNFLKTGSSNSATLLKPASVDVNSKISTPIPGRKQPDLQLDTEISEIIKVNNSIHKSPEKRQRISDSSDSELEEIVENSDQSLLKNLEEIKETAAHVGNEKKKRKKCSKKAKKGNKKTRKL